MTRHCASVFLLAWLCSSVAFASPLCDHQQQPRPDATKDTQKKDDSKKTEGKPDSNRSDDPPRWKWWLNAESKKELGLKESQAKQIDQIFEAAMPKQRERWHELEQLDEALTKIIKENTADVATVTAQVEKVEKLRAEVTTARTVMIYRMHLLLTPEQRVKLDALRARLDEERKKQDEERKRQGQGPGRGDRR
jgi:Spy/CpxP family protein refolding chaperone